MGQNKLEQFVEKIVKLIGQNKLEQFDEKNCQIDRSKQT